MYFNKHGIYNEFGRILKENVDVPILLAGRMDDPEMANTAIGDCCDMVGYGRPLLADPYLPRKLATDKEEEIRPCLGCHLGCSGRVALGMHPSCAVNPQAGREMNYRLHTTDEPKTVLIAGGGVAGMEAALVLKQRGHHPILVEKSGKLGGVLNVAAVPDFKKDERRLIQWFERELEARKVDVRMNTEVTPELARKVGADVIITAVGAKPVDLALPGNGSIMSIEKAMELPEAQKIVVIGGGLVGCETALWLAQNGKEVTLVEKNADLMTGESGDVPIANKAMLMDLVKANQVKIMTGTQVRQVDQDAIVVHRGGEEASIPADAVVQAAGFVSCKELYYELRELNVPVFNIGDSRAFHNVMQAVWDAFEIAISI